MSTFLNDFEVEVDLLNQQVHAGLKPRIVSTTFFGQEGHRVALTVSGSVDAGVFGGSKGEDVLTTTLSEDEVLKD